MLHNCVEGVCVDRSNFIQFSSAEGVGFLCCQGVSTAIGIYFDHYSTGGLEMQAFFREQQTLRCLQPALNKNLNSYVTHVHTYPLPPVHRGRGQGTLLNCVDGFCVDRSNFIQVFQLRVRAS